MGLFDNARKSFKEATTRDPYFASDAEAHIKITEVRYFETKMPGSRKGPFFKVTGEVVKSNAEPRDGFATRVGQVGVQLIDTAFGDPAFNDIARFAVAVYSEMADATGTEFDIDDLTDEEFGGAIEALYSEDQPAVNLVLGLRTVTKTTKSDKPFSKHLWSLVGDVTVA